MGAAGREGPRTAPSTSACAPLQSVGPLVVLEGAAPSSTQSRWGSCESPGGGATFLGDIPRAPWTAPPPCPSLSSGLPFHSPLGLLQPLDQGPRRVTEGPPQLGRGGGFSAFSRLLIKVPPFSARSGLWLGSSPRSPNWGVASEAPPSPQASLHLQGSAGLPSLHLPAGEEFPSPEGGLRPPRRRDRRWQRPNPDTNLRAPRCGPRTAAGAGRPQLTGSELGTARPF